jgi:hypothetical protein
MTRRPPPRGQSFIDNAIADVTDAGATDAALASAIITLTAAGADPQQLYAVNSNDAVSAVTKLNGVTQDAGPWNAPYTLLAYREGNFSGTATYQQALISAVLAAQGDDGSWEAWGDKIQSTANMIAGLAPYAADTAVGAAIDDALAFLSGAQAADGTFDAYGTGRGCEYRAMVVIGLAAAASIRIPTRASSRAASPRWMRSSPLP